MNSEHVRFFFVIAFTIVYALPIDAQQVAQTYVTLDSDKTSLEFQEYVARDSIILKPGFRFMAQPNSTFKAQIDECLLFPPTSNTYGNADGYITSDPLSGGVVGAIKGSFDVTSTGAAQYSVPIECADGINGIKPNIAINYNSQAQNSVVGFGWNLSGLSTITRVGSTHHHDGANLPIMLNNNDNLMLDGQRLIRVYGSNLQNESQYKTEAESFSKITMKTIDGKLGFEVQTKSGTIMYYGSSSDSYIQTPKNSTVWCWLLKKVIDVNGNYATYNYNNNLLTGEYTLVSIRYTGNDAAGVVAANEIVFNYYTRGPDQDYRDVETFYIAGEKIQRSSLLKEILIKHNGVAQKKYSLSYHLLRRYSQLKEISLQELTQNTYINPTQIAWGWYSPSLYTAKTPVQNGLSWSFAYLDINGDGKTDALSYDGSTARVLIYLANGNVNSFFSPSSSLATSGVIRKIIPGDYNGDGLEDMVYCVGSTYYLAISNGSSFSVTSTLSSSSEVSLSGDFNGDGKCDFLIREGNNAVIYVVNSSNQFLRFNSSEVYWGTKLYDFYTNDKYLLDFNGNGKTDLFVMDAGGYRIYEHNGASFVLLNEGGYPTNNSGLYFGDFNGDGKTDMLTQKVSYGTDHNTTAIHYSTGIGFEYHELSHLKNFVAKMFVGDYTGDGKSDIGYLIYPKPDQNDIYYGVALDNVPDPNLSLEFRVASFGYGGLEVMRYTTDYDFRSLMGINTIANCDFDGDGKDNLFFARTANMHLLDHQDESLCVKSITDGMGMQTHISYTNSSNTDIYSIDSNNRSPFPIITYCPRTKLVNTYKKGYEGAFHNYAMKYTNGRCHMQGKGFLGFQEVDVTDVANNLRSTTINEFHPSYGYAYPSKNIVTDATGATTLSTQVKENNLMPLGNKRFYHYIAKETTSDCLKGISSTVEMSNYDNYGNPQTIITKKGILTETKTLTYTQSGSWCPNKLASMSVTSSQDGCSITRVSMYEYSFIGNPTKEIFDPDDVNRKEITYGNIDPFGHPLSITVSANGESINSSLTYSPSGQFIASRTSNLAQTTSYQWDEAKGVLLKETDHKGRVTSYLYDSWGRQKEVVYPSGNREVLAYQWGSIGSSGGVYWIYKERSGQAPECIYYSRVGQEVCRETRGLNNTITRVFTQYYDNGRVKRVSKPLLASSSPGDGWDKSYVYDAYGRIQSVTTPMGTTESTYQGVTQTVKSPLGSYITTLNSAGQVASKRSNGKSVHYSYYPSGLIKTTMPDGGAEIRMFYDTQGNRAKLIDPDTGTVTSSFNGFGKLVTERQQIHKQQDSITTTYSYIKGELLSRIDRNGEVRSYTYDKDYRLSSVSLAGSHKIVNTYDDWDRIIASTETIDGRGFVRRTEYDAFGRVKREYYPSGYYLSKEYDANGYLLEVKDGARRSVWKAVKANAYGSITEALKGGRKIEYTFDDDTNLLSAIESVGIVDQTYLYESNYNLASRGDNILNQRENFSYDSHNRLTQWITYSNGLLTKESSIEYNATTGNITSKSDLGNMIFGYGEGNGKPHALTSLSAPSAEIPSTTLSVTYTDFKKIKTLTQGSEVYTLVYGADEQRRKSVYSVGGEVVSTRYYLGNYEEEISASGDVRKIHYIGVGDRWEALCIMNQDKDSLLHVYTDLIGSPIAITDASHRVLERYAFDPWGKRRNPQDWSQADGRTSWITNRGFTGHEHIDAFGIINMNGRVYDPAVAMFLSPDPYIQSPDNWLNFNRYEYCLGNPFRFTDPSGNSIIFTAMMIVGIIVGAYIGGSIANNEWLPWKWDFNNPMTYIGMVGGALAGVGVAYGIGALLQGTLAVALSTQIGGAIKIGVDFVVANGGVIFQGLGWATIAGGGGYIGYEFIKSLVEPKRPDGDGKLTFSEARDWYQNGKGEPLTVDIRSLGLEDVRRDQFDASGKKRVNFASRDDYNNLNDALVYGNVIFKLDKGGAGFKAMGGDRYDFDLRRDSNGEFKRNVSTAIGWFVNSHIFVPTPMPWGSVLIIPIPQYGTPYDINITGTYYFK